MDALQRLGRIASMVLVGACGPQVGAGSVGTAGESMSSTSSDNMDESSTAGALDDLPDRPGWDLPTPVTDCGCEPGSVCVIIWADFGCSVGCRSLPDSCGDAPSCDPACNWDLCQHVHCNGEQTLDEFCSLTHYTVTGWACNQGMLCNPWLDECPRGEGCHPYDGGTGDPWWRSTRCYWPGNAPSAVGQACVREGGPFSAQDNCENHAICWNVDEDTGVGTCIPLCGNAPHDPSCPIGTDCVFADVMDAAFCLPACDPFADSCALGYRCTKVGDALACMPSAPASVGLEQPCMVPSQCEDTLACIDGACVALCNLDAPVCPPELPTCVDAQTNVAHVGVCSP
jgi:hypothetical protein